MARKRGSTDIALKHCEAVDPSDKKHLRCNYCGKDYWGGVTRMKNHLAGVRNECTICEKVPDDVREFFAKLLNSKKKKNEATNLEVFDEEIAEDVGKERRGLHHFFSTKEVTLKQTTMNGALKDRELVIRDICRCIYGNALPFNLVRSPLFTQMLKSVGEYGKGLKPPSYHEVRVSYLKNEVDHVKDSIEKYKNEWKRWGCTLMCDGWTDEKSRSITNFLVNSPSGTVFLKSVDTSDAIKDGQKMFELLDKEIVEIGVENVVQVVTDGASNLVSAGEKLEDKYTSLCWSPCAAHCLDLVLEDIGKLPIFHSTITNAKRITTYIYRHPWILALFRDHSGGRELARPAVTRFATSFLTLSCILNQKSAIKSMFVSDAWTSSSYARKHDGKEVVNLVSCNLKFWNSIKYCLQCVGPIVRVLRLVDGDSKPAMPYIYEAMDRAKEQISRNFNNVESRYKKIWEIIDLRWNRQLHRPLHVAAYYLNPKFHYAEGFDPNSDVIYGLHKTIEKMIADDTRTRILIDSQLEKFKKAHGLFGLRMAKETRDKKQPALWWESYGGEVKELQKIAMRILSLTCSATGCERNWSTFEQVHTKRRNRLEQQRLNGLVYVKYNLQLDVRQKIRVERGEAYDPICLSDIESDDEWITEKEDPCLPEDSSWMDVHEDFTFDEGAPSSKRKRGPRNLNAKFDMDKRRKGKAKVGVDEVEEIYEHEDGDNRLTLVDEEDLSDIDLEDYE